MVTGPCPYRSSTSTPFTISSCPLSKRTGTASVFTQACSSPLFRQAFVEATGHCNFQPAGYIAALNALQYRLNTGHWGNKTEPGALNAAAAASGFGAFDPYVRFRPPPLVNSLFPR